MMLLMKSPAKSAFALLSLSAFTACGGAGNSDSGVSTSGVSSSGQVSVQIGAEKSLNGASSALLEQVAQVIVNVKRIELVASGARQTGRVCVDDSVGPLDLMALNGGLSLPLSQLELPPSVGLQQVRLILESDGNEIVFKDGSRCELRTPSAGHSGLKIVLGGGIRVASDANYTIDVKFDLERSVLIKDDGRCLLKPVIHTRCEKSHRHHDGEHDSEKQSSVDRSNHGDEHGRREHDIEEDDHSDHDRSCGIDEVVTEPDADDGESTPPQEPVPPVVEPTPTPVPPPPVVEPTPTPAPTPAPVVDLFPVIDPRDL
ncbi:MAG: DUF4382 domain-containing protein [Bdellovibrionales bacterium]|nr:DUF4382 domain-containing protein [Bdellovibrionales bacterium]